METRLHPSEDYRLDRFVEDLDELRAHFGYQRWLVVGHSFGATLGLAYASAFPGRVTGLVYCSGVGLDWPKHKARYRQRASARLTSAQLARRDELAARARSWDEEVEWRTLCWLPDHLDPADAAHAAATELPVNLECNRALNAEAERWAVDCARVGAPVLIVHGAEDPRPVACVEGLVEALPSAELAVVANAGHQPWCEQSDVVRGLLRHFIYKIVT